MSEVEAWLWIATHERVTRLVLVKISGTAEVVLTLSVLAELRPIPSHHHFRGAFLDVLAEATRFLEELGAVVAGSR